jgi:DNA-binding GntR family transcriptional regulator
VLESARNHILLEFGEQLSLRSRWFFAPLVATLAPRAWIEHREVAGLIAAGDADSAALAMHAHISMSRDAYLETRGSDRPDAVLPPAPRSPAAAPPHVGTH